MRIQLVSDLHLERFSAAGRRQLFAQLAQTQADVLVVAGDFTHCPDIPDALEDLSNLFPYVMYVVGNHEFYGYTRRHVVDRLHVVTARLSNVRVLDEATSRTTTIDGQRFIGCPMWFPQSPTAILNQGVWSDFLCIDDFSSWVYRQNEADVVFLRETVTSEDIVVTHYLPAPGSVDHHWVGSDTNCYFLCDQEDLIMTAQPKAWLHGHTHHSANYRLGTTQVVCNPFGYLGHAVNDQFDPALVLDL